VPQAPAPMIAIELKRGITPPQLFSLGPRLRGEA
jgi:hypothetical protein